jgi:hypothetical protein
MLQTSLFFASFRLPLYSFVSNDMINDASYKTKKIAFLGSLFNSVNTLGSVNLSLLRAIFFLAITHLFFFRPSFYWKAFVLFSVCDFPSFLVFDFLPRTGSWTCRQRLACVCVFFYIFFITGKRQVFKNCDRKTIVFVKQWINYFENIARMLTLYVINHFAPIVRSRIFNLIIVCRDMLIFSFRARGSHDRRLRAENRLTFDRARHDEKSHAALNESFIT